MIRLFHPRYFGAHLAMVVAVGIATGLGFWQLDAWQTKRDAAAVDLTEAPAKPITSVIGGDDPFPSNAVGQPVTLSGRWLADATVFVADREDDGKRGYWAVTPLAVDGTESAIPVVRGWTAEPEAETISGTAALTGWLQPGEGSGLPDDDPNDDVVPELRIPTLVDRLDMDLYGAYLIAEKPGAGLVAVHPDSAPVVGKSTALRNILYAIEWWVFALFALVVWLRWCRDTLNPPEPDDETEQPTEEQEPSARSVGSGA